MTLLLIVGSFVFDLPVTIKKNPQFWCVNKCKGNLCYIKVQLLCCKMKVWKKFILGRVLALTSVPLVQCYRNWASKLTWSWSFSWFVIYPGKMEMSFFFNFSGFLFTTAKVTSLSVMLLIAFIFWFTILSSSTYIIHVFITSIILMFVHNEPTFHSLVKDLQATVHKMWQN